MRRGIFERKDERQSFFSLGPPGVGQGERLCEILERMNEKKREKKNMRWERN